MRVLATITADVFLTLTIIVLILFRSGADKVENQLRDELAQSQEQLSVAEEKSREALSELEQLKEERRKGWSVLDLTWITEERKENLLFCKPGSNRPSLSAKGPPASWSDVSRYIKGTPPEKRIGIVHANNANACMAKVLDRLKKDGVNNWRLILRVN